jgi:histidine triad (HIT) family protein
MNDDCIFCKIASHAISTHQIAETDKAIAFLDVHPRAKGHTLVIPKAHASTLLDLPDEDIVPVFALVKQVAGMLSRNLGVEGLTIGINHGKVSGQEVDHLHVHLVPRSRNDGGGSMQSIVNNPSSSSLEETVERIIKG